MPLPKKSCDSAQVKKLINGVKRKMKNSKDSSTIDGLIKLVNRAMADCATKRRRKRKVREARLDGPVTARQAERLLAAKTSMAQAAEPRELNIAVGFNPQSEPPPPPPPPTKVERDDELEDLKQQVELAELKRKMGDNASEETPPPPPPTTEDDDEFDKIQKWFDGLSEAKLKDPKTIPQLNKRINKIRHKIHPTDSEPDLLTGSTVTTKKRRKLGITSTSPSRTRSRPVSMAREPRREFAIGESKRRVTIPQPEPFTPRPHESSYRMRY